MSAVAPSAESITFAVAEFAARAQPPRGEPCCEAAAVIAELRRGDGDGLDPVALELGAEVALRLAEALGDRVEGGWSVPTAALAVASAVTASRAAGLDAPTTEHAIGLAATQAGGFAALEPTVLGELQRTHAVAAGAEAARLAAAGIEAHRAALEGRRGLFALVAPTADPADVVHGLGRSWRIRSERS
jgi:2-methylcitrate dehydratase PrpD